MVRAKVSAGMMVRVQVKSRVKTSLKLVVRASRGGTGQVKVRFQVAG